MSTLPSSGPASDSSGRPTRILIIDDSAPMLEAVAAGLRAEGFDVITTNQTVGAARHLGSCDLVILDFHMPGLDGATVLQSLKSAAQRNGAQCMFLLYTSDDAEARRYKVHGFDAPLMRKGNIPALVSQIRSLMRLVRARSQTREK